MSRDKVAGERESSAPRAMAAEDDNDERRDAELYDCIKDMWIDDHEVEIYKEVLRRERKHRSYPGREDVEAMEEPLYRLLGAVVLFQDLSIVHRRENGEQVPCGLQYVQARRNRSDPLHRDRVRGTGDHGQRDLSRNGRYRHVRPGRSAGCRNPRHRPGDHEGSISKPVAETAIDPSRGDRPFGALSGIARIRWHDGPSPDLFRWDRDAIKSCASHSRGVPRAPSS